MDKLDGFFGGQEGDEDFEWRVLGGVNFNFFNWFEGLVIFY